MVNLPLGSEFDVIIIGAGPAGGNLARELSKKKWKVLLIEKSKEIGEPNFSSGGIPNYLLDEFNLPLEITADYWNKFRTVTPNQEFVWEYNTPKPRGYVLKFKELKKFLVKDAKDNGCKVMVGTSFTDSIVEDSKVTGIKFSGYENGEVRARILVDASGPFGALSTNLKLRPDILSSSSVALEYILSDVDFPVKNSLSFYVGNKYMPNGYAWVFPMGKDVIKVGVIAYDNSKYLTHETLINLLKDFMRNIPSLNHAHQLELHGGSLYMNGGIKQHVFNNVIIIGDAAAQVNPLGAEGIRPALRSSRMAANAIDAALKSNDITKLAQYEQDWKTYIGNKWKLSYMISQVLYHKVDNKAFDESLSLLKELSPEDIFNILFEYKFEKGLKLLPHVIHHLPLSVVTSLKSII